MSTELLSTPGKLHELKDDLESLWFVLLFESLHFVKNNQPHFDMSFVFDDGVVCHKNAEHIGGRGKRYLYSCNGHMMNTLLQFRSEPLTTLVRQIYQLFRCLNTHYLAEDPAVKTSVEPTVEKLNSCAEIKRLLDEALNSNEWPTSPDKVPDQYPSSSSHLTAAEKDIVAMSYANRSLLPSDTFSGGEREEGNPHVLERPILLFLFFVFVFCFFLFVIFVCCSSFRQRLG